MVSVFELTSVIHNNQSLLYVSYSWNFRHRLVRYYWYYIFVLPEELVKCSNLTCRTGEIHPTSGPGESDLGQAIGCPGKHFLAHLQLQRSSQKQRKSSKLQASMLSVLGAVTTDPTGWSCMVCFVLMFIIKIQPNESKYIIPMNLMGV